MRMTLMVSCITLAFPLIALAEKPPTSPEAILRVAVAKRDHALDIATAARKTKEATVLVDGEVRATWVPISAASDIDPIDCLTRSTKSGRKELLLLRQQHDIRATHIDRVSRDFDVAGRPGIQIRFNEVGSKAMRALTKSNIDRSLCVVVDGKVVWAATIQSEIGDAAQVTGRFTLDQVDGYISSLRAASRATKE
ncbi:MAG: hypothetical protein MI757_09895 [Pirellulales bacterium]|nr:hypothetical protein [Pirellulales bacterium]